MSKHRLNVPALHQALDAVRAHAGLTWRDLAEQTGVSASTFTRLSVGKRPDADALCSLLAWLRLPLDRFTIAREGPGLNERTDTPP